MNKNDTVTEQPKINNKEYKVAEIIEESPDVKLYKFRALDNTKLDFDPGMFVMIKYKDQTQEIARAFSIASEPNSETLDFYIHLINGRFTSKIALAKVGDIYYITGPYGQFKFIPGENKKLMFIAGGTGIAPFISMLRYIITRKLDVDVILFYSVRFSNEIIARSELQEMEKLVNLKTIITVTREDTSWNGEHGRITKEMIEKYMPECNERMTYICGPLEFAKAMKNISISCNIPSEKISADIWG